MLVVVESVGLQFFLDFGVCVFLHDRLFEYDTNSIFVVALWNRADHYIFILWFLLSSSYFLFPRLISAVADWMSAILPHMVWP